MTSSTIVLKDFHKISAEFSNTKTTNENNKKDFSQILKGERNKQSDTIKDEKDINKIMIDKTEKFTEEDVDLEDIEEVNSLYNSIYELLIKLSSLPDMLELVDIKDLDLEIENLSFVLETLLNQENLYSVFENQEEFMNIFKNLDELILTVEDNLKNGEEVSNGKFLAIEENLIDIKDNINNMKHILSDETKNINQINKSNHDSKDEKNIIELNQTNGEELDLEKVPITEKDLPKEVEQNIENPIKSGEEINRENLETSTSIFGIEDKTTFRQDFEVENKEFQEINKKIIFEQIVEKAKLIVDDNKQEIRIKLKPDILGELILKMEVVKGEFLAKILVDNYRTKELLEASLHEFKENMKENGLEIKTFEVFVGTNEDFERENRQEFFFNKKPSKLKIKNNGLKEIQAYDETLIDNKIDIYYEGQLNLLA